MNNTDKITLIEKIVLAAGGRWKYDETTHVSTGHPQYKLLIPDPDTGREHVIMLKKPQGGGPADYRILVDLTESRDGLYRFIVPVIEKYNLWESVYWKIYYTREWTHLWGGGMEGEFPKEIVEHALKLPTQTLAEVYLKVLIEDRCRRGEQADFEEGGLRTGG